MVDVRALDKVIKQTLATLEKSRDQILDIADNARSERERIKAELQEIQNQVKKTIDEVDLLERKEKQARIRLMEVSRNFHKYTEEDMRQAYEKARQLQIRLGLLRERETQLRLRRDQLEISLRKLEETVEKAENLASQVGVVLNFLGGNLQELSNQLEEIQQRQLLGLRIIKAQEEERKRVAREIHDGPAQSLANVILRAEICEKLLAIDPSRVGKELSELKNLVKQSLQDVRKIIFDLRPMVLDDLGLIPTLKRFMANLQEESKLEVDFTVLGQEERLAPALEVAVFRLVQEALNNVKKHARASRVQVRLETTPERINVSVKDNGCGFNPQEVFGGKGESYGLIGMRERVELLEGKINIDSAPGKGTQIRISIPLQKRE
nr:sensor histidine kinase [Calderihabitans maritimus]